MLHLLNLLTAEREHRKVEDSGEVPIQTVVYNFSLVVRQNILNQFDSQVLCRIQVEFGKLHVG